MFRIVVVTCGTLLLVVVWLSVLRTTLIPRRSSSRMARWTARACAAVGTAIARMMPPKSREWVLELCAPASLFLMAAGWMAGLAIGFGLLAIGLAGAEPHADALVQFFGMRMSGIGGVLAVAAAASAALVAAAFTAYLVHFMHAYRRREGMIVRSATQMNLVTDADELLADFLRSGSRESLDTYFAQWAGWLADIYDSHVSYPGLVYHRSAGRLCWPKAALIVMDTAALVEAVAPRWAPLNARVLLNVGTCCLQRLARHVGIALPLLTISLQGREEREFGDTMRLAVSSGLPAERDINCAWEVFQDARVRYAPYAVLIGSRLLTPWHNGETDEVVGSRTTWGS
jgi:hypothetical protein